MLNSNHSLTQITINYMGTHWPWSDLWVDTWDREPQVTNIHLTEMTEKRPLFITYFAKADNMLLPFTREQKTYYCPRKMLLPWRQITRRKL
jgi:hypothetical protein